MTPRTHHLAVLLAGFILAACSREPATPPPAAQDSGQTAAAADEIAWFPPVTGG